MKLKFDPKLPHQLDAINAVVNAFEGQSSAQSDSNAGALGDVGLLPFRLGNGITLPRKQIRANVRKVQEANGIEKIDQLQGLQFTIEMETGTGKTYVYLRTIFELSKRYGLKKFIIVVPSIAIRAGVLKSISIMKNHFRELYDKVLFSHFEYDSKKLDLVRQFATNNQIQIMVINIQSFLKDLPDKPIAEMTEEEQKRLNVIYRENDATSGHRPIEFIQAARPVVIIDEPQSVDTTNKGKRAIRQLNPAAVLRYSATHRDVYNLLYRLDPVKAYDLRLVKRIEVSSVVMEGSLNDPYVRLLNTRYQNGVQAQIEIHKKTADSVKPTRLWVKRNTSLYDKSGKRGIYRDGYTVRNIGRKEGEEYIEFRNGKRLLGGEELGGVSDEITRAQIKETIKQHLRKEEDFKGQGIKVLSLFFISKVADYRGDGTVSLGKVGQWFEEAYRELTGEKPETDLSPIHNGYFSEDKGKAINTNGTTAADAETYKLIMEDKERLLDPSEPLRFIFSHSALREGWDNPNVFQICTLNKSRSTYKKRQEIGRGLRLPVDRDGEQIDDESINRLTVIANESYEEFARTLQEEFEEDCGIKFGRIEKIAFAAILRIQENGEGEEIGQEESIKIWEKLKANDYINAEGEILDKFNPRHPDFELEIGEDYEDIKAPIIDVMRRFLFKDRVVNTRERRELKFNKEVYLNPDFKALWDKIKQRTRYRVAFDTEKLIENAAKRIRDMSDIEAPEIVVMEGAQLLIDEAGVDIDEAQEEGVHASVTPKILSNPLDELQKETELTRHTLAEILKRSGKLRQFPIHPEKFLNLANHEISRALADLVLEGIKYEKIEDHYWEMRRIKEEAERGIVRYLNKLYMVKKQEKSLFNAVEYDSQVERKFAESLDRNRNVLLFVKLPNWFKIDTPIGPYNPDWAFLMRGGEKHHPDEKLYFVRETKGSLKDDDLRPGETYKISCGRKHFEAIKVNYDVTDKFSESKLLKSQN